MRNPRHNRALRMASAMLVSVLAAACAVSTPAAITSVKPSPRPITNVELLNESSEGDLRSRFHSELVQKLGERGVTLTPGADFIADFAVSQREANVTLQPVSSSEQPSGPTEPDFRSRWYHKCKPHRVSASLVVYARSNGAVEAKSSGEFLACPDDLSQLDDLAQILVDRLLTK